MEPMSNDRDFSNGFGSLIINNKMMELSTTPILEVLELFTDFLVNTAEDRLLSSVIRNSYHVLRPLFLPILTRRPGLRKRAHPFTLPLKDDKQCIPRVLYRALLPPVQS